MKRSFITALKNVIAQSGEIKPNISIKLDDKHFLEQFGSSNLNSGVSWRLREDNKYLVAALVRKFSNSEIVALQDIHILADSYAGQGLGRKTLKGLVEFYGELRSDDKGRTSDSATKMWKHFNAKTLLHTDKGFGNSHYYLSKTMID